MVTWQVLIPPCCDELKNDRHSRLAKHLRADGRSSWMLSLTSWRGSTALLLGMEFVVGTFQPYLSTYIYIYIVYMYIYWYGMYIYIVIWYVYIYIYIVYSDMVCVYMYLYIYIFKYYVNDILCVSMWVSACKHTYG